MLADAAELDLSRGLPELSLKGYFLPEHEALCALEAEAAPPSRSRRCPPSSRPRVVLAAKPCDAAALAVVDQVMNWDYQDELWNGRRAATTIINLACPVIDDSCFCTAVGTAPDDTKGADGLLTPVEGGYVLEVDHRQGARPGRGPRGAPQRRTCARTPSGGRPTDERAAARARVAANLEIDAGSVRDWIATHFEDPLLGHARRALQRLRRLHQRVPHLPLLRHRRRGRGRRHAAPGGAAGTPARRRRSRCTPAATTRATTSTCGTASASTTSSPSTRSSSARSSAPAAGAARACATPARTSWRSSQADRHRGAARRPPAEAAS